MAVGFPNSLRHNIARQKPLCFREDGTFRILHLSDIHEVSPEMDDDEDRSIPENCSIETINVIEKCLEYAKPDLVVFGGDNISGFWEEFTYDYMEETILKIIEPIVRRNIPLAIVFGNHDAEAEYVVPALAKENQITIYSRYPNFRGCYNEADVFGCGNCSLPIFSGDGKRIAKNIWLIDSNDYIRDENFKQVEHGGYSDIHQSQIDWYESKAEKLRELNNGKPVDSILFQHIPVNQEYDLLEEVADGTENSIERDGKHYAIKKENYIEGKLRENPCPPNSDRKQFESWKKTGDVFAAFFGHDHVNTFVTELDGIKLIQTLGAGYHTYGNERGGRLIVLHEDGRELETETIVVDKITGLEK